MTLQGLPADYIERLRKFDTPTICNVIELFDIRPRHAGYMDSRIKACFPEMPPAVGYAATATYRSAAPPPKGDVYASLDQQAATFGEVPGPPVVVIQDLDDPVAAASFGEVMCTMYKTAGAAGLITSGAARDLDQVRAIGFPAFSNGVICAHGYCHLISLNIPIHVGGMAIYPGDLIHADCNGVTTIPHEIASQVADISADFVAAENIILDYLKGETFEPKGLAEARAKFEERMRALKEQAASLIRGCPKNIKIL